MVVELFPETHSVNNKDGVGCQRHGKDIMMTFNTPDGKMYDIFLNMDDALSVYEDLKQAINDNLNPER